MDYQFNIEHAKLYGVDEAIMIHSFIFWLTKNKANDRNYYDNHYWTYNKPEAYKKLFPFWTEKQIRRVLNSLIDKGVLITGNYNTNKYDQTKWYAFNDESLFLDGNEHFPKRENGKDEMVKPIPYNNTYNNKDIIYNNNSNELVSKDNKIENFLSNLQEDWYLLLKDWITYRKSIKKPLKDVSYIPCYEKLVEMSGDDIVIAQKIIEQSKANGWQGMFPIKEKTNCSSRAIYSPKDKGEQAMDNIRSMFEEGMKEKW